LERYGLGKNTVYVTFIRDGIPEKIAVKPKKETEEEKFKFIADFSVVKQL
jgi:hypothetical protein